MTAPFVTTPAMDALRAAAVALLTGPPDVDATNPAAWCRRAAVPFSVFQEWEAIHGEAFRAWLFADVDPTGPCARRARGIRFWGAMDRALDAHAPNASVLKLYAEITGMVGRNAVPVQDTEDQDDQDAWMLIEGLPPELLTAMAQRAAARDAARRAAAPPPADDPDDGDESDP